MVKNIKFKDYPEFTPNLTPREIFKLGSFGGTYWRPIYCQLNKQNYSKQHLKYPKSWWKNIPDDYLTEPEYNVKLNKYKVKVIIIIFKYQLELFKPYIQKIKHFLELGLLILSFY